MKSDIVIKIKNLIHVYTGYVDVPALQDISFEVKTGEKICIAGPSGSGKSTLLRCIGGMINPTSGQLYVAGHDLFRINSENKAIFRLKNIGFLFQDENLFPYLKIRENIALPLIINRNSKNDIKKRVEYLTNSLNISQHIDKFPFEISGGEKQRVSIAVALANDPQLIIADEPTASVDHDTAKVIIELLEKQIDENNRTLIYSTHDPFIMSKASRIIKLNSGRIE